jgi:glycosyltransferase involved in cell wall biosynthesis
MKLSVAMITYNHERFIAQALESALAQNVNFDYEIVVGDDCSTDGTAAIVLDFQRRYPGRVRGLFRNRNLGANRNFAGTLGACRGEYIAILEGDDYWSMTDKLQKQADFLDAHPDRAICCSRARFLDETGRAGYEVHPTRPNGPYTNEDLLRGNFIITCSTVFRREFVPRRFPGWFYKMKLGDWPLFAMIAQHGSIEVMDEITAVYRVHAGGAWTSLSKPARLHETARMMRSLNRYFHYEYADTITQTIASPYLELALASRAERKRIDTGKNLLACLRNGGWRLPVSKRLFAGLAAYVLIGSGYKIFSRANSVNQS